MKHRESDKENKKQDRKGASWHFRCHIKKNFSIEKGKVCEIDGTVTLGALKVTLKVKDEHKGPHTVHSSVTTP